LLVYESLGRETIGTPEQYADLFGAGLQPIPAPIKMETWPAPAAALVETGGAERKRDQVHLAGTARRVLRTK